MESFDRWSMLPASRPVVSKVSKYFISNIAACRVSCYVLNHNIVLHRSFPSNNYIFRLLSQVEGWLKKYGFNPGLSLLSRECVIDASDTLIRIFDTSQVEGSQLCPQTANYCYSPCLIVANSLGNQYDSVK